VNLLCSRDSGIFIQMGEQPADVPEGWVVGTLTTKNVKGDKTISAQVYGRWQGQWVWSGGEPGTRHCDFKSISLELQVETDKLLSQSTFGEEIVCHGWAEI